MQAVPIIEKFAAQSQAESFARRNDGIAKAQTPAFC
jgi:hypothetical protein